MRRRLPRHDPRPSRPVGLARGAAHPMRRVAGRRERGKHRSRGARVRPGREGLRPPEEDAVRASLPDDPLLGPQPLRRSGGHSRQTFLHQRPQRRTSPDLGRRVRPDGYSGIGLAFAPGRRFRKGGSKPSIVRGLRARFGNARGALAFATVATLTLLVPGVAVPTMARVFVDNVLILGNGDWVVALLIGLVSAAGLQGALVWLQRAFLARMEAKLSILMTTRFFWHLATLPMPFFGQRWPGDLVNRVSVERHCRQVAVGRAGHQRDPTWRRWGSTRRSC